jgi:diguanylate cyclase (GGDEF)-like protein/PAS domain S-box-containing protein
MIFELLAARRRPLRPRAPVLLPFDRSVRSHDLLTRSATMPRAAVRPEAGGGLVRALSLSVSAAAIPITGAFLFPDHLKDYEALSWLLLLVPAFLWAYERGWQGVATALAAGMATLSLTYAAAEIAGRQIPDLLLAIVVVYVAVSIGIGLFGDRLGRATFDAAAETLALQDPLTGLPNRHYAERFLHMQFAAAERGGQLAVVLFDLDRFDDYNQRNGRSAGDGVLRGVATLLRHHTRRMDLSARYGPEEFITVLGGCSEEGALIFAGRFQEHLRAAEQTVALPTVSAGIACYRPGMGTPGEVLEAAEQALLTAKRDGRDRVRIHGRNIDELKSAAGIHTLRATAQAPAAGRFTALDGATTGAASASDGVGRSAFLLTTDAATASHISRLLRQRGFHIVEGGALEDTIRAPLQDFDLVFVDVVRRESAAADMIREIRLRSPATRIIGIPRPAGDVELREVLDVRVDAHFTRTGDDDALLRQIMELLVERDALRETQVRQQQISNEMRALGREARLAIAASEAKYRSVVQSIQEVIFTTDAEGSWTFLNPAWTTVTGFDVADAIGQPLFRYVDSADEAMVREQFQRVVALRSPYFRREVRWRTRDGGVRWVELRLQLDASGDGVLRGTSGVLADVTERRHAQDALQRSEAYYRSLIENSGDLVAVLNADSTIRYISPAVERVFGYHPDELQGADPLRFVHADDTAETTAGLESVLQSPGVVMMAELRLRHRGGGYRHVELMCRNLLLTEGVEGIVVNARDVTERHQAEQALRESEQLLLRAQKMDAIGRLAGGVAHDFNNLLTAIQGHTDLLISDLPETSEIRPDLLEIRDAAKRATSLTRQLLAFSRRQVLQPRTVELNAVIRDMEKMLRRVMGRHVTLVTRLPDDAGYVRADRTQIEQVLLNLIVNARDAMPDGGTVTIETSAREIGAEEAAGTDLQPGPFVTIHVIDTGTGMTPEVAAQAFEPFFTTKAPGEGTGLGLSTVYGIVTQSGGNVWLRSEEGRGTDVLVALPAAHEIPAAESRERTPAAAAARGTETILLVEDEKSVRELAARILQRHGYHVLAAADGRDALELIARDQPHLDVLLTDVVMPVISGQELAKRLRASRPDLPVLFMSGYNEEAVLREGVLVSGTAFLEKPFTPSFLLHRVREILSAAAEAQS